MLPRSLLLTLIFSTCVAWRLAGVAGERVGQREAVAGLLGDEDDAVGLAHVEIAGGERLENGSRAGSPVAAIAATCLSVSA